MVEDDREEQPRGRGGQFEQADAAAPRLRAVAGREHQQSEQQRRNRRLQDEVLQERPEEIAREPETEVQIDERGNRREVVSEPKVRPVGDQIVAEPGSERIPSTIDKPLFDRPGGRPA